jgi:glycosyltransferase involved in cell wall biosynthesis
MFEANRFPAPEIQQPDNMPFHSPLLLSQPADRHPPSRPKRKDLRIAHLTPSFFSTDSCVGGGERYVYNICKAVSIAAGERDHDVKQTIISVGPDSRRFTYEGLSVVILGNLSPHPNVMNALPDGLWAALKGFDLVHIHQSLTLFGAYCVTIAKSLAIPIVSTDHGGGHEELMLTGRGLEVSSGVLSVSEYARSLTSSSFSGSEMVLIGPIDCDYFRPDPSATKKMNSVLCVGRILPHKGFDRVVEALPSSLALIIVGQPYDKKYFKLLQELATGKDVEFVSDAADDRLLELYQTTGLFIQPSTHIDCYGNKIAKPELMGLTTLEAMACGMPVVVSDAGSLPELIPSPELGLVFSTRADLEQILSRFADGAWPAPDQQSLSRAKACNTYSFAKVGSRALDYYLEAVASASETSRFA